MAIDWRFTTPAREPLLIALSVSPKHEALLTDFAIHKTNLASIGHKTPLGFINQKATLLANLTRGKRDKRHSRSFFWAIGVLLPFI